MCRFDEYEINLVWFSVWIIFIYGMLKKYKIFLIKSKEKCWKKVFISKGINVELVIKFWIFVLFRVCLCCNWWYFWFILYLIYEGCLFYENFIDVVFLSRLFGLFILVIWFVSFLRYGLIIFFCFKNFYCGNKRLVFFIFDNYNF